MSNLQHIFYVAMNILIDFPVYISAPQSKISNIINNEKKIIEKSLPCVEFQQQIDLRDKLW